LLDAIETAGGGELVIDGVARTTGLSVGDNTWIRGVPGGGLYLANSSGKPIIANKNRLSATLRNSNIRVSNLVCNLNDANQPDNEPTLSAEHFVMGLIFSHIDGLVIHDVEIRNHRKFGIVIGDYTKGFSVQRIRSTQTTLRLNQDTVHVYGPGEGAFYISDIEGSGDDDVVAINIDEIRSYAYTPDNDLTYGAIDGGTIERVFCNNANQGVRLLCQVDRMGPIFIRDVTGTVGSYAVHAGPTFAAGNGNFAAVVIDGVDVTLRAAGNEYANNNTGQIPYWNVVNIDGEVETVKISRVNMDTFGDARPAIFLSPNAVIRSLSVHDCSRVNSTLEGNFIEASGCNVTQLQLSDIALKNVDRCIKKTGSPTLGTVIATNIHNELGGSQLVEADGTNLIVSGYVGKAVTTGTWTRSKVNGDVLILTSSLSTGLLAWWNLNEASGTRASAAGSFPLTDNNTVTSTTGKIGDAALFASANSEFLETSAPVITAAGQAFTVSFWVYLNTVATSVPISQINGTGTQNWQVYILADGSINLDVRTGTPQGVGTAASALTTGAWYHIVATYAGAAGQCAIIVNNGTPVTASTTGSLVATAGGDTTVLGCNRDDAGGAAVNFLNGRLDLVGIWSRVLTAGEITELYNAGAGVDPTA